MRKHSGFSLVELSIVLVILGLLVGGVLAGQSLIRAAELRAVTSEYSRYVAAVQTFRDKYFALPGDMPNASAFWGPQDGGDGTGVDCGQVAAVGRATCNGNGDSVLDGQIFSGPGLGTFETFRFWHHLANAELIEGSFSGVPANVAFRFSAAPGVNVPLSKESNSCWSLQHLTVDTASIGKAGLSFYHGAVLTNEGCRAATMTTEEAWNIDTKLDDGLPMTGRVIAQGVHISAGCDNGGDYTDLNARYALNRSGTLCAISFLTGL